MDPLLLQLIFITLGYSAMTFLGRASASRFKHKLVLLVHMAYFMIFWLSMITVSLPSSWFPESPTLSEKIVWGLSALLALLISSIPFCLKYAPRASDAWGVSHLMRAAYILAGPVGWYKFPRFSLKDALFPELKAATATDTDTATDTPAEKVKPKNKSRSTKPKRKKASKT
jgi:hypothetical protein